MAAAEFQTVASQFVAHYYTTFDADRANLAGLYRENSMLTFESSQAMGVKSISEKLVGLPFQKVKHEASAVEAQPTPNDGILILVTGHLMVDEEQRPLGYSQAFQLYKDPAGQWFVYNDIFKLIFA